MTHRPPPRLLGNRDFVALIAAGWLSSSGSWLQIVTASVVMLQLTGSVLMVGWLNFMTFVPVALLSLAGGVLSDRVRLMAIVVPTHLSAGAVAVGLALITASGSIAPWHLIVAAFLINSSLALAKPGLGSLLPRIVEPELLAQATAVNSLQFTGGQMLGSGLAVLALGIGSPAWAFALNGIALLFPIGAVFLVRARARPLAPAVGGARSVLLDGLRYIKSQRAISLILVAVALSSSTAEVLRTISPAYAANSLGSSTLSGTIVGAFALGWALTVVLTARMLRGVPPLRLGVIGFVVQGTGVVLLAVVMEIELALVAAALVGAGYSLNLTTLTTRLFDETSEHFRGRVMSVYAIAELGSRPIAALGAGLIGSTVGTSMTLALCLVVAAIGLLTCVRIGTRTSERHGVP